MKNNGMLQDSKANKKLLGQTTTELWKVAKVVELQKQIDFYLQKNEDLIKDQADLEKQIDSLKLVMTQKKRNEHVQEDLKPNIKQNPLYSNSKADMRKTGVDFGTTPPGTVQFKSEMEARSYQSELNSATLAYERTKSQLIQVENKKGKKIVDLSSLASQNHHMRGKIDELRKEKGLQEEILKKLDRELGELHNEISTLKAKQESENSRLKVVRDNFAISVSSSKQNTRELKMSLKVIKDDLHIKNIRHKQERPESEDHDNSQAEAEPQPSNFSQGPYITTSNFHRTGGSIEPITEKHKHSKPKVSKKDLLEDQIKKNARIAELTSEYAQILEDFYIELKMTSDMRLEDALEKYGEEFEEYRIENNQIRVLSEKVDSLKTLKDTIKEEIKIVQSQKLKQWRKRDDAIAFYQRLIDGNREKIDIYNKKRQETKILIASIKMAIPEIFRKIGCEPAKDSLYLSDDFNDHHILEYLSIIERRADEILTLYDYKHADLQPLKPPEQTASKHSVARTKELNQVNAIMDKGKSSA